MRTQRKTPLASWALGLLTLAVLVLNLPEQIDSVLGLWVLFAALTAFALNFGVLLTSGEISPAHVFSIMAFLTLGHVGRAGEALWSVAVGALVGSLIQVARSDEWLPRRRVTARSLGVVAETMAHLTLSLLVGGAIYVTLGGRLPLGRMSPADAIPLLAHLELLAAARKMAEDYAAQPPLAAQMVKRSVNHIVSALDQALMHMESDQFLFATSGEDFKEALAALSEKRKGVYKGH